MKQPLIDVDNSNERYKNQDAQKKGDRDNKFPQKPITLLQLHGYKVIHETYDYSERAQESDVPKIAYPIDAGFVAEVQNKRLGDIAQSEISPKPSADNESKTGN